MTKRRIILSAFILILVAVFIIPAAAERVLFEQTTKVYTAAVDLTRTARYHDKDELSEILEGYKSAGVTTALIHEHRGTYPPDLLDAARDAGLGVALIPDLTTWLDADIERIVTEYGVKYIKLQRSTLTPKPQAKGKSESVCEVIDKYDLTLVITEDPMQLGNVEPLDFEKYYAAADGNILRSYHSYNYTNIDVMDYPTIYYQVYISAYDRNCRFITVKQLDDKGFTARENAERTIENIRLFCDKMESHGFVNEGTVDYNPYTSYIERRVSISAASAAAAVLMLALAIDLLLKNRVPYLTPAAVGISAAAFGLTFLLPESLVLLYPTLIAVFGPCFCMAILAAYIHGVKKRIGTIPLILSATALSLALIALLGTMLAALLGGTDYFLNLKLFRGVKLSLVVPIMFVIFLLVASEHKKVFKKRSLNDCKQLALNIFHKIRWYHIALLVFVAIACIVYVVRSGNVNRISFVETCIRNWLTEVFTARPRTKEIIAGWPCLILYIYFVKKDRAPLLQWIFAVGASTLYASAINTFCHVFTMVETMFLRVATGLLFGAIASAAALAVCASVISLIDRNKAKQ